MYLDDDEKRDEGIIENRDSIVSLWVANGVLVFLLIASIGATWVHHDHDLSECETRLYKHLTQKDKR